jgi:hypothetical protein
LEQDLRSEMYRREREKKLLTEYVDLRRQIQMKNAKQFREQLDKQCVSIFVNDLTLFFFIFNFLCFLFLYNVLV